MNGNVKSITVRDTFGLFRSLDYSIWRISTMAKKSRRTRRLETQKQPKSTVVARPVIEEVAVTPAAPAPAPKKTEAAAIINHKIVNFAQEYSYVYYEMRNVLVISVVMLVVLVVLSFAI